MKNKILKAPSIRATQKRMTITGARILVAKARDLAAGIKAIKSGRTLSMATREKLGAMNDTLGTLVQQIIDMLNQNDNDGDEADPTSDIPGALD